MLKVVGYIDKDFVIKVGDKRWSVYDRETKSNFPDEKINQQECGKFMSGDFKFSKTN